MRVLLLLLSLAAALTAQRAAIVIAPTAESQGASAVEAALKSRGYSVTKLADAYATRDAIQQVLREDVPAESTLIVYFTGRNAGVDSLVISESDLLVNDLAKWMVEAKVRRGELWIEACCGGPPLRKDWQAAGPVEIRVASHQALLKTLPSSGAPQWKDRADYEPQPLPADPKARLAALDRWSKEYPETQFIANRRQMYLATYQQLNWPKDVLRMAKEILAADPDNLPALTAICVFVMRLDPPPPDDLQLGEYSAKHLLANLDRFFASDKKPKGVLDEQWNAAKREIQMYAQRGLSWTLLKRGQNLQAEQELMRSLRLEPDNPQISSWLGHLILDQNIIQRVPAGLFHLARATNAGQASTERIAFEKLYVNYHGDKEGIDKLIALAKTSPFPPADLHIADIAERQRSIAANEVVDTIHRLDMRWWLDLKNALIKLGDGYFTSTVRGARIPSAGSDAKSFRGRLISASPRELRVSVDGGPNPDAILKLDRPLAKPPTPGSQVHFAGTVRAYQKDPYQLILDCATSDIR